MERNFALGGRRRRRQERSSPTLDQEKYCDRLRLESLEALADQVGMDGVFRQVLTHYRSISLFLFLDGYATDVVLAGPDSCGIPQGCPLGPFMANLGAAA